eukprot:5938931-Amphidinium_carterae.2
MDMLGASQHALHVLRQGMAFFGLCRSLVLSFVPCLRRGPGSSARAQGWHPLETLAQGGPPDLQVAPFEQRYLYSADESAQERLHRHIRERRWIFSRYSLRCPDDYPWQGQKFEPARNYTRTPWTEPIPLVEWEVHCGNGVATTSMKALDEAQSPAAFVAGQAATESRLGNAAVVDTGRVRNTWWPQLA